jgi:plastocyanin
MKTSAALCGALALACAASLAAAQPMAGMPMNKAPAAPVSRLHMMQVSIDIAGHAFTPANLIVSAGATVTWVNLDADAHNIINSDPGHDFRSAALDTHDRYAHTFTRPGVYHYFCGFHPFMTGTITVR